LSRETCEGPSPRPRGTAPLMRRTAQPEIDTVRKNFCLAFAIENRTVNWRPRVSLTTVPEEGIDLILVYLGRRVDASGERRLGFDEDSLTPE